MEMEGPAVRQDPFHIIDNIYYVGTKFVSSHLFTSESGHILIDTGMPSDGPHILNNIEKLGFDYSDIRYVIITHGHFDHLGSADYIVKQTKAIVCMGEEDVSPAEHGTLIRFDHLGNKTKEDVSSEVKEDKMKFGMAPSPVRVDRRLHDGDEIRLGPISIGVHHTPGHTAGTCSYSFQAKDNGKEYTGMLSCGIGVNVYTGDVLRTNIYGANIEAYISSLKRLRSMNVDIWLEGHPFFNQTFAKMKRLKKETETTNPFIDPEGRMNFLDESLQQAISVLHRLIG